MLNEYANYAFAKDNGYPVKDFLLNSEVK